MKTIHYIFILLWATTMSFISCQNEIDLPKVKSSEHMLTISLSSDPQNNVSRSTKAIGHEMTDLTNYTQRLQFQWSDSMTLNLLFVQGDTKRILNDIPVDINNYNAEEAYVRLIVPQDIDVNYPYELYGFVGNAHWVKTTNGSPQIFIPVQNPSSSLSAVAKNMPMYFKFERVNSENIHGTLKHLGFIAKVHLENNSKETQYLKQMTLSVTADNGSPVLPKVNTSENGEKGYYFSFNGSQQIEKEETPWIFKNDDARSVITGNHKTFYVWQYFPEDFNTHHVTSTASLDTRHAHIAVEGDPQKFNELSSGKMYVYGLSYTQYFDGKEYFSQGLPEYYDAKTTHLFFTTPLRARKDSPFNYEVWMKDIPDNTPFIKLLLPGTHDAATYTITSFFTSPFAQCQGRNIDDQLLLGVRCLDLRPKVVNKTNTDIEIYHGPVATGVWMDKVYQSVVKFLQQHPSETVVLLIKDENSKGGKGLEVPMAYLNAKYQKYIVPQDVFNPMTTLKQMRGKILTLYRDEALAGVTNTYYIGSWLDDTNYDPNNQFSWVFKGYRNGLRIKVFLQDNYKNPGEKKFDLYKDLAEDTPRLAAQHAWSVNYLSASGMGIGWSPYRYAEYLNPKVADYLQYSVEDRHSGMLFIDYAGYDFGKDNSGSYLVQRIIDNNFRPY